LINDEKIITLNGINKDTIQKYTINLQVKYDLNAKSINTHLRAVRVFVNSLWCMILSRIAVVITWSPRTSAHLLKPLLEVMIRGVFNSNPMILLVERFLTYFLFIAAIYSFGSGTV